MVPRAIDLAESDNMNRIARLVFRPALSVLFLFTSLLGAANSAQEPAPSPGKMTIWQARRVVAAGLRFPGIRFRPDGFDYDVVNSKKVKETVTVNMAMAPAVEYKHVYHFLAEFYVLKQTYDAGSLPNKKMFNFLDGYGYSETFAASFNVLRALARDPNAPLRTFTQRAAAWRALTAKPPIPEEVRAQRLVAEDAFKANKPDEALAHYENGIELYPTWPEGNFNAALIAGDLGYYAAAMEHMQAYLELVPDAADAQAARDKILIWQTKAKEK
jgi:tetratricopeptide (TPR) repeat protein